MVWLCDISGALGYDDNFVARNIVPPFRSHDQTLCLLSCCLYRSSESMTTPKILAAFFGVIVSLLTVNGVVL